MKNLPKVLIMSLYLLFFFQIGTIFAGEPKTVPTFHAMSLYWTPSGAGNSPDTVVHVKFKETGGQWQNGLDMKYNYIDSDLANYHYESQGQFRGSVVNLKPNTEYEFELTLPSGVVATVLGTTWGTPPEGTVYDYQNGLEGMLTIDQGGSVDAYEVYDGMSSDGVNNSVSDFGNAKNTAIVINKSYVIVRNFTIINTGKPGLGEEDTPPVGVIEIRDGVHDVVIERCDISYFGRQGRGPNNTEWDGNLTHGHNQDSGILFSRASTLKDIRRIVIQRNKIHRPNYDCNSWHDVADDGEARHHADGPQGISMWNTKGQIVIRYNEFYSDMDHMFNDIIGGGENNSFIGSPGPDSDIYCNYLSHTWDDAIEVEGGGQNVRVWNNYITEAALAISNASVRIGPLYVWRNVIDKSFWWNEDVYSNDLDNYDGAPFWPRGTFMKMGNAGSIVEQTGHMYVFNNTIYQDVNNNGCAVGIGGSSETFSSHFEPYDPGRIVRHCTTRNNILQVKDEEATCISYHGSNSDNDFNNDLFDGKVSGELDGVRVKVNSDDNNNYGILAYAVGVGLTGAPAGDPLHGHFQLADNSAGFNQGVIINNFADDPVYGDNCDIGADDHIGNIELQYGTGADFYLPGSRYSSDNNNELIENGDFADGSDGWELEDEATNPQNNFDLSTVDYDNGEAKITINHEFGSDWQLEFHHPITGGVEAGKDYVVEFKARTSAVSSNISCLIREWHDSYHAAYLGTVFNLTSEYATYKTIFHADTTDTMSYLTFGLSKIDKDIEIYIDDVHMKEVDAIELLSDNYFESNSAFNSWMLEKENGGTSTVEIFTDDPLQGDQSAKINIEDNVNADWQLEYHHPITGGIQSGEDYIIKFKARTMGDTRNMSCLIREWHTDSWHKTSLETVTLTSKSNLYTIVFHADADIVAQCDFTFGLSGMIAGTKILIDDVHVWKINGGLAKRKEAISKEKVALEYSLSNNYPNPFNPTTIIQFSIKKAGNTTLDVYNILGQKVKTLVNRNLTPGKYTTNFNASNLTSGIYFYLLQSNDYREIKKMMLIK